MWVVWDPEDDEDLPFFSFEDKDGWTRRMHPVSREKAEALQAYLIREYAGYRWAGRTKIVHVDDMKIKAITDQIR